MKKIKIITVLLISLSIFGFSQNECNVNSDGIAVKGYDVVSYFKGKAKKGKPEYMFNYKKVKYLFSCASNLKMFKENPKKYLPQYGGWCAYAMGTSGKKVNMDPKTFEIRDGKLYLFYKSFFNNTYTSWLKENPIILKNTADKNWDKIQQKSL